MKKHFSELQVGDVIGDAHHIDLALRLAEPCEVGDRVGIPCAGGGAFIERVTGRPYLNKTVVVLELEYLPVTQSGVIKAGYSHDDASFCLLELHVELDSPIDESATEADQSERWSKRPGYVSDMNYGDDGWIVTRTLTDDDGETYAEDLAFVQTETAADAVIRAFQQ